MDRIGTYRSYLQKKPGDRFALYALALELEKAADPAAEAAYRELLELHPGSGAGWLRLGGLLRDLGRPEAALAVWRAGIVAVRAAAEPDAAKAIGEIEVAIAEIDREG